MSPGIYTTPRDVSKATRYAVPGTCEAIISGSNPRLPRYLPVYRLLNADTRCSAVDLPLSGVPSYEPLQAPRLPGAPRAC